MEKRCKSSDYYRVASLKKNHGEYHALLFRLLGHI